MELLYGMDLISESLCTALWHIVRQMWAGLPPANVCGVCALGLGARLRLSIRQQNWHSERTSKANRAQFKSDEFPPTVSRYTEETCAR